MCLLCSVIARKSSYLQRMKHNWIFENSPVNNTLSITRLKHERKNYYGVWGIASRYVDILDRNRPVSNCRRFWQLPPPGKTRVSRTFGEHWAIFRVGLLPLSRRVLRGLWAKENRRAVCTLRNPIAFEFCRLFVLSRSPSRGTHARIFNREIVCE